MVAYVFGDSIVSLSKTAGKMVASTKPETNPQTRRLRTAALTNGSMIAPAAEMAITVTKGEPRVNQATRTQMTKNAAHDIGDDCSERAGLSDVDGGWYGFDIGVKANEWLVCRRTTVVTEHGGLIFYLQMFHAALRPMAWFAAN